MKTAHRERARTHLEELISDNPLTAGMYVRTWGDHLILGREEPFGPSGELVPDDRLTARATFTYGLSVRRHTGRWEKTPFTGTLDEITDIIPAYMQHIITPYS